MTKKRRLFFLLFLWVLFFFVVFLSLCLGRAVQRDAVVRADLVTQSAVVALIDLARGWVIVELLAVNLNLLNLGLLLSLGRGCGPGRGGRRRVRGRLRLLLLLGRGLGGLLLSLLGLAGGHQRVRLATRLGLLLGRLRGRGRGSRGGLLLALGIRVGALVLRVGHEKEHRGVDLVVRGLLEGAVLVLEVALQVARGLQVDGPELRNLLVLALGLLCQSGLDLLHQRRDLAADVDPGLRACTDRALALDRGVILFLAILCRGRGGRGRGRGLALGLALGQRGHREVLHHLCQSIDLLHHRGVLEGEALDAGHFVLLNRRLFCSKGTETVNQDAIQFFLGIEWASIYVLRGLVE